MPSCPCPPAQAPFGICKSLLLLLGPGQGGATAIRHACLLMVVIVCTPDIVKEPYQHLL